MSAGHGKVWRRAVTRLRELRLSVTRPPPPVFRLAFSDLPKEVREGIFAELSFVDCVRLTRVSRSWRAALRHLLRTVAWIQVGPEEVVTSLGAQEPFAYRRLAEARLSAVAAARSQGFNRVRCHCDHECTPCYAAFTAFWVGRWALSAVVRAGGRPKLLRLTPAAFYRRIHTSHLKRKSYTSCRAIWNGVKTSEWQSLDEPNFWEICDSASVRKRCASSPSPSSSAARSQGSQSQVTTGQDRYDDTATLEEEHHMFWSEEAARKGRAELAGAKWVSCPPPRRQSAPFFASWSSRWPPD